MNGTALRPALCHAELLGGKLIHRLPLRRAHCQLENLPEEATAKIDWAQRGRIAALLRALPIIGVQLVQPDKVASCENLTAALATAATNLAT